MRTSVILCRLRPCPPGPDAVDDRGNGKALAWHSHRIKAARSPLCKAGGRDASRPAPKARSAAHPQERQHSAAEGGTRDRVRPAGALGMRRLRQSARISRPRASRSETRQGRSLPDIEHQSRSAYILGRSTGG